MKKFIWSLAAGLILAGSASAQYGGFSPYPMNFMPQVQPMPNIYNRGNQPLSPYLNLVRGTGQNPAADYFFGVRPGTQGNSFGGMNNGMNNRMGVVNMSQMRQGYLPQAGAQTQEPLNLPDPNVDLILPPSGHQIYYGNYFGISRTGIPSAMNTSGGGVRGAFFSPPLAQPHTPGRGQGQGQSPPQSSGVPSQPPIK